MENKFKIRNLQNEIKGLEKKKKKLQDEIRKLEKRPFYTGEISADILLSGKGENPLSDLSGKYGKSERYSVKYYKLRREVICELTWKPQKGRKEIFIGRAICRQDEEFDYLKGMNIALLKAMIKAYDFMIRQY